MNFLSGKKTKLTGIGMVIFGIGGLISGLHDANTAVEMVFEGLGFIFMRHAIKKASGV
jgi:Na+/phosphate symporter